MGIIKQFMDPECKTVTGNVYFTTNQSLIFFFPNPYIIGLFFPNEYPQFEAPKHLREVLQDRKRFSDKLLIGRLEFVVTGTDALKSSIEYAWNEVFRDVLKQRKAEDTAKPAKVNIIIYFNFLKVVRAAGPSRKAASTKCMAELSDDEIERDCFNAMAIQDDEEDLESMEEEILPENSVSQQEQTDQESTVSNALSSRLSIAKVTSWIWAHFTKGVSATQRIDGKAIRMYNKANLLF